MVLVEVVEVSAKGMRTMVKKGKYPQSPKFESIKVTQQQYADAIMSSTKMGQDLYAWFSDAIAHHAYRCEQILGTERYAQACKDAAAAMQPSPLESDFRPNGPPPIVTRPQAKG